MGIGCARAAWLALVIGLLAACPQKKPAAGDGATDDGGLDLEPGDVLRPPDKLACVPGLPGSWAVGVGGTREVYASGFAVDLAGNAALTGKIAGDAMFGDKLVSARVDGHYGFVAAADAEGRFVSVELIGDQPGEFYFPSVAAGRDGRRFLTGTTEHPVRLGAVELPAGGFVVALEESGAAWITAIKGGMGNEVFASARGDVFVTATMTERVAEAGVTRTRAMLGTLSPSCDGDGSSSFVARLDAGGTPLWATPVCAAPGGSVGAHVAVDAAGNAVVAGSLQGQITLGKHTVSAPAKVAVGYVARLDAEGEPLWVVPVVDQSGVGSLGVGLNDVAVDDAGNAYVMGFVHGKTTIAGQVIPAAAESATLLAKIDADGKLVWSKLIGGSEAQATAVAATPDGRSVFAVSVPGLLKVGNAIYDDPRREPIVVVALDADGNTIGAIRGGNPSVALKHLRLDGAGNAYVTGILKGSVWFGCDLLGSSNTGLFVWKAGKLL